MSSLVIDTAKLALVYPRQSSDRQVEKNIYSLENQLQLKQLAMADGFPEEAVLVIDDDLGKSAQTIAKRVGMTRALKLIDQGLVGALYAEDQTRLSRDIHSVDHMEIGKRCRLAKVPIWYGGSWRDLSNRNDRLVYKVEAVIGSEVWGDHIDKMQKARRSKAEQGRSATKLPRGYRANKAVPKKDPEHDKLLVYEPEAELIRAFAQKVLEVGSLRQAYLETSPFHWPDGTRVTLFAIRHALKAPIYRGNYVFGSTVVEGSHEAIIPPELGRQLDHLLATNQKTKRAESPTGNELAGLLWCPDCARRISSGKQRRAVYKCTTSTRETRPEDHFSVMAAEIDALVVDDLFKQLGNGIVDRIVKHLEGLQRAQSKVIDTSEASRRALSRRVDGLTRAMSDPDLAPAAMKVLIQQLNQASEELEALDTSSHAKPTLAADLTYYQELRRDRDFMAMIPALWADNPIQWRRSWIRRFIERVEIVSEGAGRYAIRILYVDGRESRHHYRGWSKVTPEELALMKQLASDPAFPGLGKGGILWVVDQLAAQGYERERSTVGRVLRRLQSDATG
jgi:hypothetical protein